jgi:hypothetical protein
MLCSYNNVLSCQTGSIAKECGQRAICSGNGRCMSLREISRYDVYENNEDEYDDWDADMIYGCACDDGWEGPECDRKTCPHGDDPLTFGRNEIQIIDCLCWTCKGGLKIRYKGQYYYPL